MKWTKGKVLLAGCGGFFFFFILWLAGILYTFFSAISAPLEPVVKDYYLPTQVTPVLKGVVVAQKTVSAPFSRDTVALCLLKFGTHRQYRNRKSRHKTPEWEYNDKLILLPGQETFIKINDTLYVLNFKNLITGPLHSGAGSGRWRETFATDSYIRPNWFTPLIHSKPTREQIATDSLNKIYFKKLQTVKTLYGLYPDADKFIERKIIKNTVPYTDIIVHEILFSNGDSIAIKGKIENGKIIPLY